MEGYRFEEYTSPEITSAFKKRIKQKLKDAKLAWDAERYGPGFIAYRKARHAQFAKDYLMATLLYNRMYGQSLAVALPRAPARYLKRKKKKI